MAPAGEAPRPWWTTAALALAATIWCAHALVREPGPPEMRIGLAGAGLVVLGLGAITAWRGAVRQQRLIEELRHDAARSRSVIDDAGDPIVVIDERATIVTFNRAAARMFGYAADEVVGGSLEALMTNGAREHHRAYLAQHGVTAMVEAAKAKSLHKGVRKRGEVFPFELTMTEWRDGERRMFTGVMRDVTDHQRTAEALLDTKARYEGVYENFATPMFTYALAGDGGFVLESMNRAAEDFTGLTRFATLGRTPEEMAPGDRGRALRRAMLRTMTSGEVVTEEVGLHTTDGLRLMPVAVSPMHEGTGEIRRMLVCVRERTQDTAAA